MNEDYLQILFDGIVYSLSQSASLASVLIIDRQEILRPIYHIIIESLVSDRRVMPVNDFFVCALA